MLSVHYRSLSNNQIPIIPKWAVLCHFSVQLNEAESTSLLKSSSVEFEASTLSLTFKAMVHYVGESADGNFDDDFNLGLCPWCGSPGDELM